LSTIRLIIPKKYLKGSLTLLVLVLVVVYYFTIQHLVEVG